MARGLNRRRSGGAWKVAYADFATAMMALFIVLWIMNAGPAVKRSVSGYFNDPRSYGRKGEGSQPESESERKAAATLQQSLGACRRVGADAELDCGGRAYGRLAVPQRAAG